ncbi:MAG: hypothetical protein ACK5JR_10240 [Tropicimonas sp.]|uniref:hypothetical protein n=1 Tax=Tropicimonas sp. TaxID=2067044 RepID=UPI003A886CEE
MKSKIILFGIVLAALTACSRQAPEPEPIYAQPMFDKAGNASCPAGYELAVLEESGATVCSPIQ